MSYSRYLLNDFFTAREFDRIDADQRRRSRSARRRRSQLSAAQDALAERIDDLEDDLGQAILLVRALSDLVLDKGLLTTEELAKKLRELDLADGVADGKTGFGLAPADPPDGDA